MPASWRYAQYLHARIQSPNRCAAFSVQDGGPRLTQFEVGQIVALHRKGYVYRDIANNVFRSDPEAPPPSLGAIGQTIRHWTVDPSWTGKRARGSGRPRKTTKQGDAEMVKAVTKWRGKRKTTSTMIRRVEPVTKIVSARTVRRRLNEAELKWFRRRRKTIVPESPPHINSCAFPMGNRPTGVPAARAARSAR